MRYLEEYLKTISERGNIDLAESVLKTAEDIGNKYIKKFSFSNHEIGLLFGNVQSGKTAQMFSVICKAADLGFPVFLILTTDNVILQQQTLERVKSDIKGFCICGENDGRLFLDNSLIDPVIIVLKKNYRILKLWSGILKSTGFMKGNPLFIIDDEADAASLNTLINKGGESSINKYLNLIKNEASSSIYLQVTGTPQALLLQSLASGWRPSFTYYFHPGKAYLGGDFFFPENKKAECVVFNEELDNSTRTVLIHHLLVSGQISGSMGKVSNCLIHPSVRQNIHKKFADDFQQELIWCKNNLHNEFKILLRKEYEGMNPQKSTKISFDLLFSEIVNILKNNQIKILIMNGKNAVESEEYSSGFNIIIGGNTLGRGVTFPSLHTIYYTRTSKKPQADTMWQHSRMFGYDRDRGLMKVFIDEDLYKLFLDINHTNNSIISQIEKDVEKIHIYYPKELKPTRNNVLDNKKVYMISGGTNYYPFDPENDDIEILDKILEPFDDKELIYQVNLRLMLEILNHVLSKDDFSIGAFSEILKTLLADKPTAQGYLIVRRNRDVAKGTGALLSPNDWELGTKFAEQVVLTMYKVTGKKGWNNRKIWIPNIKLPSGVIYYNLKEE